MKKKEQVNHPSHYGGDGVYEVINVLEAWGLDKDFLLGNTVKYVARAGKKDDNSEIQDLKKSLWYLKRKIANLEKKAGPSGIPYKQGGEKQRNKRR